MQGIGFLCFLSQGVSPTPSSLLHTFALRVEDLGVAQKFFYEGGYAVWVAGCETVSFYDEDGGLLGIGRPRGWTGNSGVTIQFSVGSCPL